MIARLNPGSLAYRLVSLLAIIAISLSISVRADSTSDFADTLYRAWQHQQPIPHWSQSTQSLDLELAYRVQFQYVRQRLNGDSIGGYKAGLTSSAGQQKFNVTEPLAGVLLSSGKWNPQLPLPLDQFNSLMIETEVGFRLNRSVSEPLQNIEQLKPLVAHLYPVFELPELGFASPNTISGPDLVAANVASSAFVIGPAIKAEQQGDLNALEIQLWLDDQPISLGKGTDASGDQWQALLWLINQRVSEGYVVTPEHLLITGTLGKMLAVKNGVYRGDFGWLGQLQLTIIKTKS